MQTTLKSRSIVSTTLIALATMVFLVFTAGPARASFGIAGVDGQWTGSATGDVYTQAGGHPYEVKTEMEFNHHLDPVFEAQAPDAQAKDIYTSLPAGLVGNPDAVPKCPGNELALESYIGAFVAACPGSSQIGTVELHSPGRQFEVALYNLEAPTTVPARLGFTFEGVPVVVNASLRSDGDYGLDIGGSNLSEALPLLGLTLTVWGDPTDPVHDGDRCQAVHLAGPSPRCGGTEGDPLQGPNSSGLPPVAFMTLPSRCTAPGEGLETRLRVDSWDEPGVFQEASYFTHAPPNFPAGLGERGPQVGVTGCDRVPFQPSMDVVPTVTAPDSPAGLDVRVAIPQEALTSPKSLAQSHLKKTVVTLPEGMTINPSAADGLGACTPAQIGLHTDAPAGCPDASKIGTVEVQTPVLEDPLLGSVYLASQSDNPFGSLLAAYLAVEGHGVVIKVPARIDADPVTGRLTTTLDDLPQQPVSSIKLSLKSGPRGALATPAACGSGASESTLGGWSGSSVSLSSPYAVGCTPGLGAFSPSFTAGTTSNQAGAFSPFLVSFSRQDGEQNLSGLTVKTPAGLLAILKGVERCPEPQASQGACGDGSLLGHVTATAGVGASPFETSGGKAFLTGPYKGSPFGLAVTIPAKAGPFDLGTVVVRSRIDVDPHTSRITIVSDPFPTILQGIPLRVRTVNVMVDRPGFMFNPTNCSPLSVDGTIASAQGATASVSSHFQAANCASLPFKPSFKVSTKAKTSKAGGVYLSVKLTPGQGQANIGKVAVSLPKQLPSRLTTIQQACTEAVFAQNPASCPAGSNIGIATASTPILANPVTGPVYLVSHGGAAFPDLVMILQGEGVTLQVLGSINIKSGITSSAFNSIPDAPISSFELSLPQGPHSALGSNVPAKAKGSLCGQNLVMPTTLTGQNGAQVKQSTKIAIAGCPKAKAKAHKAKHKHGKRK